MANGAGFCQFNDLEKFGMHRRLAARNLDDVRMAFVANDGIKHLFDQRQVAELLAFGPAGGVADRTAQIAVVANLDQSEAGVLLMVGTQATIIGASPFDRGVVDERHFGGLDEDFAAAAIVVDVVGNEDAIKAVLGAELAEMGRAVRGEGIGLY